MNSIKIVKSLSIWYFKIDFDLYLIFFIIFQLSIQEAIRFLQEVKISFSKTSYEKVANFILTFKNY